MKPIFALIKKHWAILLLLLIHFWGIIGLLSPLRELFNAATPLTLVLTFILLVKSFPSWKSAPWKAMIGIFLLGIIAETIGTHTGLLFGAYGYGETLGWSVMGTPLVIGLNWIVLSIGALYWAKKMTKSKVGRVFAAAALMVFLDFFIEPVAIEYGYWIWDAGTPPLHNYVGWFAIGSLAQAILVFTKAPTTRYAGQIFIVLTGFFGILALATL